MCGLTIGWYYANAAMMELSRTKLLTKAMNRSNFAYSSLNFADNQHCRLMLVPKANEDI